MRPKLRPLLGSSTPSSPPRSGNAAIRDQYVNPSTDLPIYLFSYIYIYICIHMYFSVYIYISLALPLPIHLAFFFALSIVLSPENRGDRTFVCSPNIRTSRLRAWTLGMQDWIGKYPFVSIEDPFDQAGDEFPAPGQDTLLQIDMEVEKGPLEERCPLNMGSRKELP